jgi:hypothetical protein
MGLEQTSICVDAIEWVNPSKHAFRCKIYTKSPTYSHAEYLYFKNCYFPARWKINHKVDVPYFNTYAFIHRLLAKMQKKSTDIRLLLSRGRADPLKTSLGEIFTSTYEEINIPSEDIPNTAISYKHFASLFHWGGNFCLFFGRKHLELCESIEITWWRRARTVYIDCICTRYMFVDMYVDTSHYR